MLRYKIPQDVQREDTIVGPLTLRQLIICGVGFGTAYAFYITLSKNYYAEVWLPPVLFISLITAAVAFLEIRGLRFTKWLFLMIEAFKNPPKRVWNKSQSTQFLFSHVSVTTKPKTKKENQKQKQKEKSMSHLDELSRKLDRMTLVDEKENDHIVRVPDHHLAAASLHKNDLARHETRLHANAQKK